MIWLIVLLGLILRLISLSQSLWLDEAIQVWASRDLGLRSLFFEYTKGDFNPPLYHLLLHFWIRVFGDSEISVRMPSVILGTLCVLLFYLIINGLTGSRVGGLTGLAALLLATSPLHIYYSQEARMYSLSCFCVLFLVWRFLIWQNEKGLKNGLFLAISLVLMGFSHYLTLFVLPVIWMVTKRKNWKQLFSIHFPLTSLYFLYLPIFKRQLETGMAVKAAFPIWGRTVGSFSFKAVALLPVKFIIGRISIYNKLAYGIIAAILVAVYWGLVIKLLTSWRVNGLKKNKYFLILSCLFLPPILGFLISFFIPVFSYFRFLFVLPFFYLLISLGVEEIKRESLKRLTVVFLISVNLICSFVYLFNPRFHREDWKGMVSYLKREPGIPVLILLQVKKPFDYYNNNKDRKLKVIKLEDIGNYDKITLISYSLEIFDQEDKIRRKLIEEGFKAILGESFNKVGIERWEKR